MSPHSLVTGGAGFIGSHVAQALLDRGHTVTVVDDLSGGYRENVPAAAQFVEVDVSDESAVTDLFRDARFEYVFHLAAYAAEGLSHFIRRFNYVNNVVGSMNVLNAAVNTDVRCFVFTSSIAAYGRQPVPMTEEMTPKPEDPYGIAKYAVEMDLAAAHEMFGLDYIVFRPHNVYGEAQNLADRYRNQRPQPDCCHERHGNAYRKCAEGQKQKLSLPPIKISVARVQDLDSGEKNHSEQENSGNR